MATSVTLPALGESVTEGTVTRWLKQPGDQVAVDEPLLEVSTDKVDTEIPSPIAGTLLEIKVQEDETVEVGAELCTVGDEGESAGSSDGGGQESAPSEEQQEEQSAAEAPAAAASSDGEDEGDRKTETETNPPAAHTDGAPPAQETQTGSADTAPEAAASEAGTSGGSGSGTSVTLPALGESVTEGTVTRWLKQVGDDVAVDEPLLEVSTDKVDTEIPSPVAGKLLEIKVQEDETVEVGAELAVVGSGEAAPSGGGEAAPAPEAAAPSEPEAEPEPTEDEASSDGAATASSQGEAIPAAAQVQPDAGAESSGESAPAAQAESTPAPAAAPTPTPAQSPTPAPASAGPGVTGQARAGDGGGDGGAYVTPLVRKMAAEHNVDLASLTGTGVGGRIRKQDVLDAAKAAQEKAAAPAAPAPAAAPAAASGAAPVTPSPLRGRTEPMSRLRKVIAKRMVESLQTSAQLTTVVEVDVTPIARLRNAAKEDFAAREGVKLSFMPFFAKAAIDALKEHPSLNATLDTEKGEVTFFDHENVAIAVDTEKGLLTPVIKDAGDLSIAGLARKIADIAERTRSNKIGPDELAGGTFTITNTGSRGALFDTPIINQPQVAILGTGAVVKRPVVIDDANLGETIAVRNMVYLALTYDHRLVDGADAARFLSDVKARLEAGQFEV
ncbi:2-oxoglutarate dehydrogenase, E2 component, dihydrolipoamide succinyltransferase [Nocardioides mesophilus]|uniref:Dihydrolipoamide acetyltransferase component of pyruvate dehydrogenase complex n=1 Tax=Nocardioides mesophilus TaxID=433659 RepID=A0A7G9RC83_9ACTN|nr:2-oxoglutarate dehydrogenase, E2 component, dihydrolipoamide succinyltransferase [Nocardioides mesophilus]QNN53208.1 2-oxoglutarate dehydrogenase, E2 component, dihydrolipoamide succinyltransferase [Nocardioides mesophilus]